MSLYGKHIRFNKEMQPQSLWSDLKSRGFTSTELANPGDEATLASIGLVEWSQRFRPRVSRVEKLLDLDREVGTVRALIGFSVEFSGNYFALIEHPDVAELTRNERHQGAPGIAVLFLGADFVHSYRVLGGVTLRPGTQEFTLGRAKQTEPLIDRPHIGGGIFSTGVSREHARIHYRQGSEAPILSVQHLSTKRPTHDRDSPYSTFVIGELAAKEYSAPSLPPPRLTETTMALDVTALRAKFGP